MFATIVVLSILLVLVSCFAFEFYLKQKEALLYCEHVVEDMGTWIPFIPYTRINDFRRHVDGHRETLKKLKGESE